MGTITDKLTYLQDTKTAIKNAIVSKGISVSDTDTFRSYADKISSITGSGSSDWQPQPDWWDIDSILDNDTEDAVAKIIFLLNDSDSSTVFHALSSCYKIVYSDGTVDTNNSTGNLTHSWDTTKDKECSLGYKTRYMIMYYNVSDVTFWNVNFSNQSVSRGQPLYIIVKNFNSLNENRYFSSLPCVEYIKYINSVSIYTMLNLDTDRCLRKISGYQNPNLKSIYFRYCNCFDRTCVSYQNVTDVTGMYNSCQDIDITIPNDLDMSKITNYNDFINSSNVKTLNKLDFSNATKFSFSAPQLFCIKEILGKLKFSLNISSLTLLNHDTLIRFLNALYDYASEGSTGTYTLKLGTTNLAKLTDEEKAIATNKGWTLA